MRNHAVAIAALIGCLGVLATPARAGADAKSDIKEKASQAMENFDLLEFEEAKRLLGEAVGLAKKAKLKDELVASIHVKLGVVYFSGFEDEEAAKLQFIAAVEIQSSIEIDPAYSTGPMAKLLTSIKKEYGSTGASVPTGDDDDDDDDVDCEEITGLTHALVDEAPSGKPARIVAHVGDDLKAKSMVLHYRPKGAEKFAEVKMKLSGDCGYKGSIPKAALKGDVVHYYVTALDRSGKKVGNKGSMGSPNIIEVMAVAGSGFGDADDENPLGSNGGNSSGGSSNVGDDDDDDGGSVSKVGPIGGAKKPKLFLSLAAGSGAGYVSGETEQVKSPVGCCVAPAYLHVLPEIGYYINEQLAIGVAFRMGFPIGANRMGHATAAPAGLVKVHYTLSPGGEGLELTGAIGGGIIRHTVKIEDQPADMNVDTTASGPFLVGGGLGYVRALSGPMKFVVGLNALAGFSAGVGLGEITPGFALQFDANLGILFAF